MVPVETCDERRCHIRGGSRLAWLAGYLVKFQIQDVLKLTVRELDILRTAEELSTLNSQIRLKFPFSVPGSLVLPETFSIEQSRCLHQCAHDDGHAVDLPAVPGHDHLAHRVRGKTTCIVARASKCWLYVNSWYSHRSSSTLCWMW